MKALIFENEDWINLTPISYMRPVFELKCGFHSMLERFIPKLKGIETGLKVRDYLVPLMKARYGMPVNDDSFFEGDVIIVNGQYLMSAGEEFVTYKEGVYTSGNEIVYAVLKADKLRELKNNDFSVFLESVLKELPAVEINARMIRYPWNLIHENPGILKEDFNATNKRGIEGTIADYSVIYGPRNDIYVGPEAEVHPLVVLDTNPGPIYIGRKAKIFPNTRIEGPCYIGEDTQIMPGSNIREGNSFGPVCRIGGEVEESIFHAYSNKYHDGFIGHSYIGEFVNLGALTTNSDLKNDYTAVSVNVNGTIVDTGDLKVGSFIGDHTKTSIGTALNTGSSIGVMCNITAGGILPKSFPSFVWYVNNKYMKGYGLEMMLATARAAMERRKRKLTAEEEQVLRHIHTITGETRLEYVRKSRKSS